MKELKIAFRNVRNQFKSYLLYFITLQLIVLIVYCTLAFASMLQPTMKSVSTFTYISQISLSKVVYVLTIPIMLLIYYIINYANNYFIHLKSREYGIYKIQGVKNKSILKLLIAENLIFIVLSIFIAVIIGHPLSIFLVSQYHIMIDDINLIHDFSIQVSNILFLATIMFLINGIITWKNYRMIKKAMIIDLIHKKGNNYSVHKELVKPDIYNLIIGSLMMLIIYFMLEKQLLRLNIDELVVIIISFIIATYLLIDFICGKIVILIPKKLIYRKINLFTYNHIQSNLCESKKFISIISAFFIILYSLLLGGSYLEAMINFGASPLDNEIIELHENIVFQSGNEFNSITGMNIFGNFDAQGLDNLFITQESDINQYTKDIKPLKYTEAYTISNDKNFDLGKNFELIPKFTGHKSEKLTITTKYKIDDQVKLLTNRYDNILVISDQLYQDYINTNKLPELINELERKNKVKIKQQSFTFYENKYIDNSKYFKYVSNRDINKILDYYPFDTRLTTKPGELTLMTMNEEDKYEPLVNQKSGEDIYVNNWVQVPNQYDKFIVVNDQDLTTKNGFIPLEKSNYLMYNDNLDVHHQLNETLFEPKVQNTNRGLITKELIPLHFIFVISTVYIGAIIFVIILSLLGLHTVIDAERHKQQFTALTKIGFLDKDLKQSIHIIVSSYFVIPLLYAMIAAIFVTNIITNTMDKILSYETLVETGLINKTKIPIIIGIIFTIYVIYYLITKFIYWNIVKD